MAFIETPSFPTPLAYGAVGGPWFSTTVTITQGGTEQRNRQWVAPRGVWEVGLINRSVAETATLLAFFRTVAQGRAHGFRFRDFLPGEDTGAGEPLGTGTGAEQTLQLVKRYTAGTLTADRPIYKPMAGSVVVYIDGEPTDAFVCDYTTGLVTLTADVGAVLTASYLFECGVRFDQEQIEIRRVAVETYSIASVKLYELKGAELLA